MDSLSAWIADVDREATLKWPLAFKVRLDHGFDAQDEESLPEIHLMSRKIEHIRDIYDPKLN